MSFISLSKSPLEPSDLLWSGLVASVLGVHLELFLNHNPGNLCHFSSE